MPIYDYQCTECEATFEELIRSPRDEDDLRCERCGSSKVERQVSSFAMGRGSTRSGGETRSSRSGCGGGSCGSCRPGCCH